MKPDDVIYETRFGEIHKIRRDEKWTHGGWEGNPNLKCECNGWGDIYYADTFAEAKAHVREVILVKIKLYVDKVQREIKLFHRLPDMTEEDFETSHATQYTGGRWQD